MIDQLAGVPIPASAVEPLVFGQRVRDYQPAMLDELLASGEVTWSGAGQIGGGDGWIAFHPAESAPLTLRPADRDRVHRHPSRDHGDARRRRRVLLPATRRRRFRTELQTSSVGTDLGRLDHRRHVRPGAGDAVGTRRSTGRRGHPHTGNGNDRRG